MTEHQDEHASERSVSGVAASVKRRGLIAGAAAFVVGLAAKAAVAEETVSAATGGPLIIGGTNFPTSPADSTSLENPGSVLAGKVYQVINFGSTAPNLPVNSRIAISGLTSALGATGPGDSTATLIGVYGNADKGVGLYGEGGADGVYGHTDGVAGNGVYGDSASVAGNGVYGYANNGIAAYGVYGASSVGHGVVGTSSSGPGVSGSSTSNHGVSGVATGTNPGFITAGLYGTSATTYGIIGNSTAPGYSGLTGTTSTPGVAALGATATVPTAYAAFFTGTTVVNGNFAVTGSKSAAVAHPDGTHRLLYCMESPEAWFEDFGKGTLVNGKAEVTLDPDFAALVHTEDYHVFLTEYGSHHTLAVMKWDATGFVVEAGSGGASGAVQSQAVVAGGSGKFSWRVVAKRKGNPGARLEKFTLPKINIPDPAKLAPVPEIKKAPVTPPPAPPQGGNPADLTHGGKP